MILTSPKRSTDELVRQCIPALVQGVRMLNSTPHIIIYATSAGNQEHHARKFPGQDLGGKIRKKQPEKVLGGNIRSNIQARGILSSAFAHTSGLMFHHTWNRVFSMVRNAQERSWEATTGAIFRPEVFTVRLLAPTSGLMFRYTWGPRFFRIILRLPNHLPLTYGYSV